MAASGDRRKLAAHRAAAPSAVRSFSRVLGELRRLLRLRNWRVRTKLVAVLAIPTVAVLAVGGLGVSGLVADADAMDRFSQHVTLGNQVTALVHELQRERGRTAGRLVVAGEAGVRSAALRTIDAEVEDECDATDDAIVRYRKAARALRGRFGASQQALFERAGRALAEIGPLRAAVTAGWIRQGAVFDEYTRVINALLAVLPEAGAEDETPLGKNMQALGDLARAKELAAQIRGRLYAVAHAGVFGYGEFQGFAELRAQRFAALNRFKLAAGERHLRRYERVVQGQATLAAERIEQSAVDRSQNPRVDIDPEQWWAASTTAIELVRTAESGFIEALAIDAGALSDQSWRASLFIASGTLLVLINAALISLVVSRSMALALRRLRRHALEVASHRLPAVIQQLRTTPHGDPVVDVPSTQIDSKDEIGEVADSFDTVHREAVRLAVEQAVLRRNVSGMFVNLARRSQSVVERQITLIDELERHEQSPEQLGHLFQLDHLATRMRRHNESLLVLAGGESRRHGNASVPLRQVVLAAIAEIEQYPRVRHQVDRDLAVVGHGVTDLVHLLAELLENATQFSPPDTEVWVNARRRPGDCAAIISIEDHGMGMTSVARAEANRMLAEPPILDVSVSHRMGLYVVSHLAARHQIGIELGPSATGGVIALVWLPAGVLDLSGPAEEAAAAGPSGPQFHGMGGDAAGSLTMAYPRGFTLDAPMPPPQRQPSPGASGTAQPVPAPGLPSKPDRGLVTETSTPIWWSESGQPAPAAPPRPRVAPPLATSEEGLPLREPMALLPWPALVRPEKPHRQAGDDNEAPRDLPDRAVTVALELNQAAPGDEMPRARQPHMINRGPDTKGEGQ